MHRSIAVACQSARTVALLSATNNDVRRAHEGVDDDRRRRVHAFHHLVRYCASRRRRRVGTAVLPADLVEQSAQRRLTGNVAPDSRRAVTALIRFFGTVDHTHACRKAVGH